MSLRDASVRRPARTVCPPPGRPTPGRRARGLPVMPRHSESRLSNPRGGDRECSRGRRERRHFSATGSAPFFVWVCAPARRCPAALRNASVRFPRESRAAPPEAWWEGTAPPVAKAHPRTPDAHRRNGEQSRGGGFGGVAPGRNGGRAARWSRGRRPAAGGHFVGDRRVGGKGCPRPRIRKGGCAPRSRGSPTVPSSGHRARNRVRPAARAAGGGTRSGKGPCQTTVAVQRCWTWPWHCHWVSWVCVVPLRVWSMHLPLYLLTSVNWLVFSTPTMAQSWSS